MKQLLVSEVEAPLLLHLVWGQNMKTVIACTIGLFLLMLLVAPCKGEQTPPVVLAGHTANVYTVAISPNGKVLASGGEDNLVKLWEFPGGKLIRTISGGDHLRYSCIESVCFTPDSRFLIGLSDSVARMWDVADGKVVRTFAGHATSITSLAVAPNGKILATSSYDDSIKLWDIESAAEVRTLFDRDTDTANCVAFSPDGKVLAGGYRDFSVILWDVTTGTQIRKLADHLGPVQAVRFSPDGKTLAVGAYDFTLWDMTTGQRKSIPAEDIASIAFSPDGKTLATTNGYPSIRLWDVATCASLGQLDGHAGPGGTHSISFSPIGRLLASGGNNDFLVKIWQVP